MQNKYIKTILQDLVDSLEIQAQSELGRQNWILPNSA